LERLVFLHLGEKTGFLSHLYIKIIFLPRQARDKHRENTQNRRRLVQALNSLGLNGIETDPDNIFDVKMLEMNGQHLTSGGIYAPPGAEPDTGVTQNATYMKEWAAAQVTKRHFCAIYI
jgi:hypothetical protein